MNWKKWTAIFTLTTIVSIIVYDSIAIGFGGPESSISHMLIGWSYKYPIFTFMMGVVMGHLFWRTIDTKDSAKIAEHVKGEGK